jgi:hypothetical protein
MNNSAFDEVSPKLHFLLLFLIVLVPAYLTYHHFLGKSSYNYCVNRSGDLALVAMSYTTSFQETTSKEKYATSYQNSAKCSIHSWPVVEQHIGGAVQFGWR